jgi:asparagine synthase (glutamine-hydrolysing)
MCGIAGYVGNRPPTQHQVDDCLARMRRRGPDHADARSWTTADRRCVWLLNSRLGIIDLDPRANQPLSSGTLSITYNGEIYNYVELRDLLCAAGRRFSTRSDTEVLLKGFEALGDEVWQRAEGMWACAIYDDATGVLTLSRDPLGEKPLFLFQDDGGLYFGSEPKFIAALRGAPLRVNVDQIRRFLVNGYRSLYKTTDTFFAGVRELPAGTLLRVDERGVEQTRYWRPRFAPDEAMGYDEAVAGVRARLTRAVEIRLRSDVPLAFCLSGGVDSNAIAAIASRTLGYAVHAFTVVEDDPRYDERAIVAAAVADLGIAHTEVRATTEGFVDRLRALVAYHDAPVYTISYLAHSLLTEAIAARGYRIAVSGTGADEILTGYYDHHLAYLQTQQGSAFYAAAREAWSRRIRPFVRNPLLNDADLFVRSPAFREHLYFGASRFAACLTEPFCERFVEQQLSSDLLRNRMLNELLQETVPVILHEDDANSMFWSIENRSPYLDRGLVAFCNTIPTAHLVRNGFAKAILRDAVRGVAPDAVVDNPRKTGFNAPITSFLDLRAPEVRGWLLADSPIFDLVRRDRIAELIERRSLPNSDSKFLFSVVSSRIFLETFAA